MKFVVRGIQCATAAGIVEADTRQEAVIKWQEANPDYVVNTVGELVSDGSNGGLLVSEKNIYVRLMTSGQGYEYIENQR